MAVSGAASTPESDDPSEQREGEPDHEVEDGEETGVRKQLTPGLPVATMLDLVRAISKHPFGSGERQAKGDDPPKRVRRYGTKRDGKHHE